MSCSQYVNPLSGIETARCTGHCCQAFPLPNYARLRVNPRRFLQGEQILDMLRPLPRVDARSMFTCARLQENGDCGIYETRPRMCTDFPYGRPCDVQGCTRRTTGGIVDRKLTLYFGCIRDKGHFLWRLDGRSTLRPKDVVVVFPWTIAHLDGGLLENGKVPDVYNGRVYRTQAKDMDPETKEVFGAWHAFYWWDRSLDSRAKSNSGFYVRGFQLDQHQEAFEHAKAQWSEVIERQKHPLVLAKP